MKNKFVKKLAAVATVATMVMGMSVSAFAATGDTTTLATNLYKDGKYDASAVDSNLSMGNGAVEDTTYVENSDGTYTVRRTEVCAGGVGK